MATVTKPEGLEKLDELACEFINSLRETHSCDAAQSCTVIAIMWGRIRKAAEDMGIDTVGLDWQFLRDAQLFTKLLDDEEKLGDANERRRS